MFTKFKEKLASCLAISVVILVSALPPIWADASLDRFKGDIENFEKSDKARNLKSVKTVFVGSSTFTRWPHMEDDFREFDAVNRGFGGSTIPEINHYLDRIVCKYKPQKVVLYAGTNDIAELKHTASDVKKDVESFFQKVFSCCPGAEIYFVSISMAPCRTEFAAQYDASNKEIQNLIKKTKHTHYIDVVPLMRDKQNKLRVDLFGPDSLHMTDAGYALWKPAIQAALRR